MFAETPTYHLRIGIINHHTPNIVSIFRDEKKEFNLTDLESFIIKHKPKVFYTVSSYHNPTSSNMSLNQRNALYNLAMKYKFYIICDEAYQLLYFDNSENYPPMFYMNDENYSSFSPGSKKNAKYDNNCNPYVISMCTFSKYIFPGLRIVNLYFYV